MSTTTIREKPRELIARQFVVYEVFINVRCFICRRTTKKLPRNHEREKKKLRKLFYLKNILQQFH